MNEASDRVARLILLVALNAEPPMRSATSMRWTCVHVSTSEASPAKSSMHSPLTCGSGGACWAGRIGSGADGCRCVEVLATRPDVQPERWDVRGEDGGHACGR
jgi:hypothetical protein